MSTLMSNRPDNEEKIHNSQIKERFKKLQNIEANQFARFNNEPMNVGGSSVTLTPDRVDVDKTAQSQRVTEYTRKAEDMSLFTADTLDRTIENTVVDMPKNVVSENPVVIPNNVTAIKEREEYGLTPLAMWALAAFATLVVLLLTVIGINSSIITQKRMRIEKLEEKRQELLDERAELQARIDNATSEETIRNFAMENGWVLVD